jgi:hypothetical protein
MPSPSSPLSSSLDASPSTPLRAEAAAATRGGCAYGVGGRGRCSQCCTTSQLPSDSADECSDSDVSSHSADASAAPEAAPKLERRDTVDVPMPSPDRRR